ncbi:MAG: IS3 family transposase [Actinobacteria bacterium]|nr:IS3 family transposase [Actinomycetota bacterium]
MPERFARMKALHGEYAVGDLCAAFGVSRSGYHRWRTATASARASEDALLRIELRTLHRQSRGTYGRPRLCAALRQSGRRHSPKRIGRLMRSLGLRGVRRGRFRPQTTQSGHRLPRVPNRLLGAAPPERPDQLWVADLTFVATQEGWLYVAGVLDRHSRRVLGLAFSARLDSSLPEAALRQAFDRRGGGVAAGLLHHSDQGLQYASATYQALLATQAITPSMSRKANCYDNAHMESFWATLKTEALAHRTFPTRAAARLAIFDYVETFYNRARLHSALGYLSPVDFEQLTT